MHGPESAFVGEAVVAVRITDAAGGACVSSVGDAVVGDAVVSFRISAGSWRLKAESAKRLALP
eukprot:CAMPEP_0115544494 /NCGR_PEP_ID=MMETSP0271-20121206/92117_1 /TAXON_ID=71861 /ORGANISM="Scrippsiella trochoidea, Strain CCMP3099" /LENGTH=62 /DNA_ID=CAMNT_0002977811 /DNA_START=731 /DNA_END=915 /DNA_ORIENTATION=+